MKNEELEQKLEKVFFSIGEVAEIIGVKAYVLRYWQTEFKQISPRKNNAGVRKYTKDDIQVILNIKKLLHDEKFTIKGARAHLAKEFEESESPAVVAGISAEQRESLEDIKARINRILDTI